MPQAPVSDLIRRLLIGCLVGLIGTIIGLLLLAGAFELTVRYPDVFRSVDVLLDAFSATGLPDTIVIAAYLALWWVVGFLGFLIFRGKRANRSRS
ncbi:MAG: hypothetical protein Q8Q41_02500 [bacterium]|nr:hypothetical protein [bacterium]